MYQTISDFSKSWKDPFRSTRKILQIFRNAITHESPRIQHFKGQNNHLQKNYQALMEDKGEYFGVTPKTIKKCIQEANAQTRNQYELNSSELTQYYAMITAFRENRDGVEP